MKESYEETTRELLNKFEIDAKKTFAQIWHEINGIKERPPVWSTIVIAILTGLLGWKVGGG